MRITGTTTIFGVIGNPVRHSFSPIMHNAAFEALGLNCVYVPMEVPLTKLEESIKGLSALGFKGVNVTIPYKEAVIPYLDTLSPQSTTSGTVNAIQINGKGKLLGHNTDGEGFINSLREDLHFSCSQKTICILGTGGASRAIALECALYNAKRIIIVGRNKSKSETLTERIKQFYPEVTTTATELNDKSIGGMIESSDLLVNATSLGLKHDDSIPIEPNHLHKNLLIYDLIYNPMETRLIQEAKKKGCPTTNGLGMLIHQGALSFRIWLGVTPPLEIMRNAIMKHIKEHLKLEGD